MCGVAGLIHRGKSSDIGAELTSMLQSLKHRGPDSTGFALYGNPSEDEHVIRFKLAAVSYTHLTLPTNREV